MAALLLSAAIKLALLHYKDFWLDETYSAYVARLPFSEMIRFTTGDVHPRFYPLLLWLWIRAAGETTARFRLLSVLLNLGSMTGMFFLGRRVLGTAYGIFAAALFAFSPILLVYSLEVRNYMLLIFVFVLLLYVHWLAAVEGDRSNKTILAYGLLTAALFYVHYFSLFAIAALLLHWAISCRFSAARIKRLFAAALLAALFAAPGVPLMLAQHARKNHLDHALAVSRSDPNALSYGAAASSPSSSHGSPLPALGKVFATVAGMYPARSAGWLALAALPFVALFAVIAYLACFRADAISRLTALLALLLFLGLSMEHLLNASRYWLLLVPVIVLAIARGLQYLAATPRTARLSMVLAASVFCIYVLGFLRQARLDHERPWSNLARIVQASYRPGDEIVFDVLYGQTAFDYFAGNLAFHPAETGFPVSIYDWWNHQEYKGWGGPVLYKSDLDTMQARLAQDGVKTVWLVSFETNYYDPQNQLLKALGRGKQVQEIALPPGPGSSSGSESEPRLYRISSY